MATKMEDGNLAVIALILKDLGNTIQTSVEALDEIAILSRLTMDEHVNPFRFGPYVSEFTTVFPFVVVGKCCEDYGLWHEGNLSCDYYSVKTRRCWYTGGRTFMGSRLFFGRVPRPAQHSILLLWNS